MRYSYPCQTMPNSAERIMNVLDLDPPCLISFH